MSSTKLFLTQNNTNSRFQVVNENGYSLGEEYEIPDAIKNARMVSDAPIDIGDDHAGNQRHVVSEKPENAIADTETFIAALAEIAGMKVTRVFDDNMTFVGYTMEAI